MYLHGVTVLARQCMYIRVASTHDVVRHSDGSPPAKCILATTTFPTDLSLDVPHSRHT